jgi:hypothetical protein
MCSSRFLFVAFCGYQMQCCGSGSAWIRNFLLDPDPEFEVSDPGQSRKLDGKMHTNHKKINFIIFTIIRYKF